MKAKTRLRGPGLSEMKAKTVKTLSLPGEFVKCPNSLLERADVTTLERNLWLVLKARCCRKDSCNPSVADLCSFVGIVDSRCRAILKDMEVKGILRTEYQNGRSKTYYPLIPPRHSTGAVRPSDPASPQAGGRLSTGAVMPKARLSTGDETDKEQIKETDCGQPSVAAPPSVSAKKVSKKTEKPDKPSDPRINQFTEFFVDQYRTKFQSKYVHQGPKDAQAVKRLIGADLGLEETQRRVLLYLNNDDPFVVKQGHTISFFASTINSYRPGAKVSPRSDSGTRTPVPPSAPVYEDLTNYQYE